MGRPSKGSIKRSKTSCAVKELLEEAFVKVSSIPEMVTLPEGDEEKVNRYQD